MRQAYSAWTSLLKARRDYEANAAAYAAEREQLQWQINELQSLECTPDSWAEWQAEHARLSHAASLIEGSQQLLALLAEDDSNCLSMLGVAQHKLAELAATMAPCGEYADMLAKRRYPVARSRSGLASLRPACGSRSHRACRKLTTSYRPPTAPPANIG